MFKHPGVDQCGLHRAVGPGGGHHGQEVVPLADPHELIELVVGHQAGSSVRISAPSGVTSTVCSNCAVRLRSFVTTVQLSGQMS